MGDAHDPTSAVQPGTVVLVEVGADSYLDDLVQLVRRLLGGGTSGIVVNVSRPRATLLELFERNGLPTERLAFIDGISKMVTGDVEESDDVIFLDSPTMLEMIAMGVDHLAEGLGDDAFVVFDSYGALITYNDPQLVYEFTNFLGNKLRLRGMRGVLVVVEGQLPDTVRGSLAQLTDQVIEWRQTDG